MKRILPIAFVFLTAFTLLELQAQTSVITFVNCSPDPALAVVDVYITQGTEINKAEDIAYQSATNFDQVPIFGNLEAFISVAPGNSSSNAESIVSYSLTPLPDAGYILILSGVSNESGYIPNPDGKYITLSMQHMEVPQFSGLPNQIGVMMAHAVTDLETGNGYIRGTTKEIAKDLSYTGITSTLSAAARSAVIVDFTKPSDKNTVYASFEANLTNYQSENVVFILSGFKTPADNNQSDNNLVLLAVLENGSVIVNPLIAGSQKATVQWVNDCPDPSLGVMDVWIDGTKSIDNLGFRKATGFIEVGAGAEMKIGFAPATSSAYRDTLKTVMMQSLRPGRTYHLVVSGVVDTTRFAKNPNGQDLSLNVLVAENALKRSDRDGKSAVRVVHTSPDQAAISIKNSATTYGTNLTFNTSSPEYTYLEPRIDTMWVYIDSTGVTKKGWLADLRGNNRAALVLASGFVNPEVNQNGPSFKLVLVDSAGNVNSNLPELLRDTINSVESDIVPSTLWRIAPNPATDKFSIVVPLTSDLVAKHGTLLTASVYTSAGLFLGFYPMNFGGLQASVTIPTTAVANGAYFVQVNTAEGVRVGSATIMVSR